VHPKLHTLATRLILSFFFGIVVLGIPASSPAQSQTGLPQEMPADLNRVDFYLITVGNGPDLHMRYGHTILRIIDHQARQEFNLNWGIFDFGEPNFAMNFALGKLNYRLGGMSYPWILRVYGDYEKRYVYEQMIHLTADQKQKLMERILWNSKPENINYKYHHFFNNCATKPRDYLDEALGGSLQRHFSQQTIDITFRDYVMEYLKHIPPITLGLDVILNSTVDGTMNKWQEMFFPEKLSEHLSQFSALDDQNQAIPNSRLLGPKRMIVDHSDYPSQGFNMYIVYLWVFGLPLVLLWLVTMSRWKSNITPSRALTRSFGVYCVTYGFIAGTLGLVMGISWLFSDHIDLRRNANLWLFWPVDWVYVVWGFYLWKRSTWQSRPHRLTSVVKILTLSHLLSLVCMVIVYWLGLTTQDLSRVLVYMAPLSGLFFALTLYLSVRYLDRIHEQKN
jgi:hypothetical protein